VPADIEGFGVPHIGDGPARHDIEAHDQHGQRETTANRRRLSRNADRGPVRWRHPEVQPRIGTGHPTPADTLSTCPRISTEPSASPYAALRR
jgi:hypothetical protein